MNYYASFYHGRGDADGEMSEWGFIGPLVGPLGLSFTYGTLRFYNDETEADLKITEGMVCKIGNSYYGDFEILAADDELTIKALSDPSREKLSLSEYQKICMP